jgi:hypothetical protein
MGIGIHSGPWEAIEQQSTYLVSMNEGGVASHNNGTTFSGTLSTALWDVIVATRSGTTVTLYKNGTSIVSYTASATYPNSDHTILIGGDVALGNSCNGSWARALLYNVALGSSDRSSLEHALGLAYGITVP